MRNIESSTWLNKPELEVIETKKDNAAVGSDFTLYAEQAVSAADDVGGGTTGAKP